MDDTKRMILFEYKRFVYDIGVVPHISDIMRCLTNPEFYGDDALDDSTPRRANEVYDMIYATLVNEGLNFIND